MTTSHPLPSPPSPAGSRRHQAIHDAMASVEDVDALPTSERLQRLAEVQQVLAAVLQNSSEIPQPGIPGMASQP